MGAAPSALPGREVGYAEPWRAGPAGDGAEDRGVVVGVTGWRGWALKRYSLSPASIVKRWDEVEDVIPASWKYDDRSLVDSGLL